LDPQDPRVFRDLQEFKDLQVLLDPQVPKVFKDHLELQVQQVLREHKDHLV
jgi:hypothetical protein